MKSRKKNNTLMYTPLPKPVAAVKWEKMGDHPQVALGPDGAQHYFEHEGVHAAIDPGDYIVGPDETGLYTIFHGAAFEQLYELARAGETKDADIAVSKYIGSTYALNMLTSIELWLERHRLSQWAQQTRESQPMFEFQKFVQRMHAAILSERK